jgi:hypothetical protein
MFLFVWGSHPDAYIPFAFRTGLKVLKCLIHDGRMPAFAHERHNCRISNDVLSTCKRAYAEELSLSDELRERCYTDAF